MASNSPSTGNTITGIGAENYTLNNCTVVGVQYNIAEVDVADRIQKKTLDNVDLWTRDTVEPAALSKVLVKIRTGSTCVTITGSPGEGKSTLGYWVLRKLKETRKVYRVSSPEQLVEVIKTSTPVILLDDVIGQTVCNEAAWKEWKEGIEQFMDMKKHKPLTEIGNLIIIGRDFVLRSGSRQTEHPWKMLVNNDHLVNMSHETVRTNEEKENILISIAKTYKVYLDPNIIKTIFSIKIPHGFPHTCKLFRKGAQ